MFFNLGSFHTASKYPLTIWSIVAKKMFNHTTENSFVKQRGVYDKMIIDCAFRENLRMKKLSEDNGGCDDFEASLTTNGMCYTFNGKHSSEIWKVSEVTNSFSHLFTSYANNNKTFGGPRTVQGILFSNHLLHYKTLLGKRSTCKRNLLQNFLFIK